MKRVIIASLFLGGCAMIPSVGPDFEEPQVNMPEHWITVASDIRTGSRADAIAQWWKVLGDEKLNELIVLAVENNKDLAIATSRVYQARAQLQIQTAPFFPSIGAGAGFQRARQSGGNSLAVGDATTGEVPQFNPISNQYSAGLDATWEIDVFGGIRRSREAAYASLEAADATLADVQVTLLADVSRAYIEIRSAEKRLAVNLLNLKSQEESLDLVNSRYAAGLVSELDVAQAKTLVEQTRAQIPLLQQERREAVSALGVLLGRMPVDTEALLSTVSTSADDPLGKLPPELPAGLPSDVLKQRPDIRRADRELAAQTARVGVAIADYFPKFSLTGGYGASSEKYGSLFNSDSRTWNIFPSVSLPIFQGGSISGNVEVQRELLLQAVNQYEKVILSAVAETENALSGYVQQRQRQQSLRKALESSQRALSLSRDLYQQGVADFQRVLDAERAALIAQDGLVRAEQDAINALIATYKALGGGWNVKADNGPNPTLEEGNAPIVAGTTVPADATVPNVVPSTQTPASASTPI